MAEQFHNFFSQPKSKGRKILEDILMSGLTPTPELEQIASTSPGLSAFTGFGRGVTGALQREHERPTRELQERLIQQQSEPLISYIPAEILEQAGVSPERARTITLAEFGGIEPVIKLKQQFEAQRLRIESEKSRNTARIAAKGMSQGMPDAVLERRINSIEKQLSTDLLLRPQDADVQSKVGQLEAFREEFEKRALGRPIAPKVKPKVKSEEEFLKGLTIEGL